MTSGTSGTSGPAAAPVGTWLRWWQSRSGSRSAPSRRFPRRSFYTASEMGRSEDRPRSEEHTSELQSRSDLVCRLLLEKKKNNYVALSNSILGHLPLDPLTMPV